MGYNSAEDFNNEGLRYDLRQHWASLIGANLEKAMSCRDENNLSGWLTILNNLHMDIVYKFKPADHEEHDKIYTEVLNIKGKYVHALNNSNALTNDRNIVFNCLAKYHKFLIRMMDKHKFFGGAEDVEGM